MLDKIIESEMDQYANAKLYPEEWMLDGLIEDAEKIYAPEGKLKKEELEAMSRDELEETLRKTAHDAYAAREQLFGEENMRELEKVVMLRVVDNHWMEHLDRMDMLREGINLRAYGQRNPLVEYKIEALDMFEAMETARASHGEESSAAETKKKPQRNKNDIGRNDPCPCGSGKKYKNCCGRNK